MESFPMHVSLATSPERNAAPSTRPASILTPLVLIGVDYLDAGCQDDPDQAIVAGITQRMSDLADEHNFLFDIITRLQPDELRVVISFVGDRVDLENLTQSILLSMMQPFQVKHQSIRMKPSIGVALYPSDTRDISQLAVLARQTLNKARRQGGNRCLFYAEDSAHQLFSRELLMTCMDRVLERGDFQTYYQPQYDLNTGALVGAEALVRWRHPKWGILTPGKFIEIAEETGSIVPLGQWVLRQACEQARQWQRHYSESFKISVNLSARQLDDPYLCDFIARTLAET
ncbi:MAG: EAL domain-containing protein, partial [Cyanobacteria bacterium P01_F01_bin.42]